MSGIIPKKPTKQPCYACKGTGKQKEVKIEQCPCALKKEKPFKDHELWILPDFKCFKCHGTGKIHTTITIICKTCKGKCFI